MRLVEEEERRMKKVLLLAPTPPPAGGIAIWTTRMLNAHLKNDWMVDVVDEKLIGKRVTFGDNNKRNISEEMIRTFTIWNNLANKLKSYPEIKVVHSCIPSTTFAMLREYFCCKITHFFKKKFIIHFRCTTTNTTRGRLGNRLFKSLCNASDFIILLNKASFDHVNQVTKTNKMIIPNFVDENEINPQKTVSETIKTVTYVGGVIESKGCNIICEVAKSFPEIEFRLIGNVEKAIEQVAKRIPNVVLTGSLSTDEVKNELENSDVFMFLSFFRGEGFSNALLEAMACGLPCIVTDWAANSDMIENSGGIVVPIQNVDSVVDALIYMKQSDVRKQMGSWNILKVQNNYTENRVLNSYVDVYEQLI